VKRYKGNIGGNYEIAMVLCHLETESSKSELFGYYYYTKNKIPIFIKGYMDGVNYNLVEYLDNGKENALFKGKLEEVDIKGKWIMNKKEMPFTLSKIVPVQDVDNVEVAIHTDKDSCLNKKFITENLTTSGSIVISKGKKEFDYKFSFDLFTIKEPIHFGNTEGLLKLHSSGLSYFEANPDAKDMSENCILFFIFFKDRIFVYEYGEPSYLDFGMGVHAEGVYLRK
ncbi:MAG TPA: hypothetical protein PK351_11740, partial [Spirochaetota bacterium]|nr:hypothetical protein [Spirochaetota bacterium]